MNLTDWAIRWQVPHGALHELQTGLGLWPMVDAAADIGQSEAARQQAVRVEAAQKHGRLFRNNVGVVTKDTSLHLRFGLANDSPQLNKKIKSGDLIGCMPVVIRPEHVGYTIGRFTSREMKEAGWKYTGTPEEQAQRKWAEIIISLGGDACFATGTGTL